MAFAIIEIPHGHDWRKRLSRAESAALCRPHPRRLSPTAVEAARLHREMTETYRLLGEACGRVAPLGSHAAYMKMVRAIVDDAVPRPTRGRVGVQP